MTLTFVAAWYKRLFFTICSSKLCARGCEF